MPFALVALATDHPWRLDITAVAAILATGATVALAFFTWRLARETRSLARETGEDVRAEWRPVLVSTEPLSIKAPPQATASNISAQVTNVGRGPAIDGQIRITARFPTGSAQEEVIEVGTLPPGAESRGGSGGFTWGGIEAAE
jgi:hypothetical protein